MSNLIINQTSILQQHGLAEIQTIIVFVTCSIMIGFLIWFIERVDADKIFGKRIVLIGHKNRCCNARNVLILEDKYKCKKCKSEFPRKVT